MDLKYWKHTDETKYVMKEMMKELESAKSEILDFGGLIQSPELEREYCRAIGYIDGIRFVLKMIEENKDEFTKAIPGSSID